MQTHIFAWGGLIPDRLEYYALCCINLTTHLSTIMTDSSDELLLLQLKENLFDSQTLSLCV